MPALQLLLLALLAQAAQAAPLIGQAFDRAQFPNPHAHISAQCYVETSGGAQNACLFCHTDGVWRRGLGNNDPQAGANPNVGDLQGEFACFLDHVVGASLYGDMPASIETVFRSEIPGWPDLAPHSLRYFRREQDAYPHQDGRPYKPGEVITDRPINPNPGDFTYGIGTVTTLIGADPKERVRDYVPLF